MSSTATENITIKLPDGSSKEIPPKSTGMDLAKSISPGLAKKSVAIDINGQTRDLFEELKEGDEVKIICAGDPKSYEILRHTTSHILAAGMKPRAYFFEFTKQDAPNFMIHYYADIFLSPSKCPHFPFFIEKSYNIRISLF